MQAGQDSDGGVVGLEGMCTLHAVVVLWVCLGETWTVVETFLNTRLCICMVYPTLWPGGSAECVYRPPLSLVPSVFMSFSFLSQVKLSEDTKESL
jgi:hypothetical protein